MKMINKLAFGCVMAGMLSACGGSGNSGSSSEKGTVSFGVTDAPITDAKAVNVAFTHIEIKHKNEDEDGYESFAVNEDESPVIIDLLALQGAQQTTLINDQRIRSGEYEWIRFLIDEDNTEIVFEGSDPGPDDDEVHALRVPSGKLKANRSFTVPADGTVRYVIDFDLRHSIVVQGNGDYKLKPVIRLEDLSEVGHIAGNVSDEIHDSCIALDEDNNVFASVYSNDVTEETLGDADAITSAIIAAESVDDEHSFEIGFLSEATYTVVVTCSPDAEEGETVETSYLAWANGVDVEADETANVEASDFETLED